MIIAIKETKEGFFEYSSIEGSDNEREIAKLDYYNRKKSILNFIDLNKSKVNNIEFYYALGELIKNFAKNNNIKNNDLKYLKQSTRIIFDENRAGLLRKDAKNINYCDYSYKLTEFPKEEIFKITHTCWVYLWQCANQTDVVIPFFLKKSDNEKSLTKNEGFIRPFGKILTRLLKNVNTEYWSNERKSIPFSVAYNITKKLWENLDMKRPKHVEIGSLAKEIISEEFKNYLKCFSNPELFLNFENSIVKNTVSRYKQLKSSKGNDSGNLN
jgi:hypothetical protein